jgi:uncharacterized protein YvpB
MPLRSIWPSRTNYKGFSGTIKFSLENTQDKTEMLQKSGINQVECEGCDFVYIAQTLRCLKTRHPDKSNIARHVLSKTNDNQGHSILLDNLKLVKEVRKQNELETCICI